MRKTTQLVDCSKVFSCGYVQYGGGPICVRQVRRDRTDRHISQRLEGERNCLVLCLEVDLDLESIKSVVHGMTV